MLKHLSHTAVSPLPKSLWLFGLEFAHSANSTHLFMEFCQRQNSKLSGYAG